MARSHGASQGARRERRDVQRERARGGPNRAPVPVQRLARRVEGTAYAARDVGAAAVSGDRAFVLGLIAVLALSVVMLSGPFQSYMDGRGRVEALQAKVDALDAENTQLTQRKVDLQDPGNVELLAREQQGMVRPGEVPYAIVPPEVARPQITSPTTSEQADVPWYRRLWEAVTATFG